MKKLAIVASVVVFLGSMLTSCKPSGPHCQAYSSKVEKVKIDRSERTL